MNYEKHDPGELRTSCFKYLKHLVSSRPSPAWLLRLILSGSQLADGLMLAPALFTLAVPGPGRQTGDVQTQGCTR